MTKKLTPWFPDHIKPARVGVYECRYNDEDRERGFAYWNGRRWTWMERSARDANDYRFDPYSSACQNKEWRGLRRAAQP